MKSKKVNLTKFFSILGFEEVRESVTDTNFVFSEEKDKGHKVELKFGYEDYSSHTKAYFYFYKKDGEAWRLLRSQSVFDERARSDSRLRYQLSKVTDAFLNRQSVWQEYLTSEMYERDIKAFNLTKLRTEFKERASIEIESSYGERARIEIPRQIVVDNDSWMLLLKNEEFRKACKTISEILNTMEVIDKRL